MIERERERERERGGPFILVLPRSLFLMHELRRVDGQRGDVNASSAASVCRTSWENYWVLVSVINQSDIVSLIIT